jgi:hypothetical protein
MLCDCELKVVLRGSRSQIFTGFLMHGFRTGYALSACLYTGFKRLKAGLAAGYALFAEQPVAGYQIPVSVERWL